MSLPMAPARGAEAAPAGGEPPLVVGTELEFPPYAVSGPDGQPDGFSIELFRAVADVMDLRVTFRPGEWSAVWDALKRGEIAALPLVARTPERAALVDLTVPHTTTYDSFFVRKDSPLPASLAAARDLEIIAMRGDAAHEQLEHAGFGRRLILTDTVPDAMRLLASGRHDAVLVSKLIGHQVLRKLGLQDAIRSGPPLREYQRDFAFAVAKGNVALRDRLDQGIAIVKATGRYDAIYRKWLGPLEPRPFPLSTLAWWVGIPTAVALVLAAWSLSLRREIRLRREREQALSRSETRYHLLHETLRDAFVQVSMDGHIIEFNDLFCQLLGYSPDEVRAITYQELTPERWHAFEQRVVEEQILPRGYSDVYEKEYRRKDGTVIPVELRTILSRDAEGRPSAMWAIVRDISGRKRAEAALEWNARRNALLTDTAARLLQSENPQAIVEELCRNTMAFLDCQAFFNFLVDDRAQRLRLNAWAGVPDEEARKIEWLDYGVAVCGCVARDGRRIVAEHVSGSADPQTELIKSYGIEAYCCHPLMAQGRLIGTLSFGTRSRPRFSDEDVEVMRDVAGLVSVAMSRLQTEQALRDAAERLSWALRSADGGAWDWDLDSGMAWWSPQMYQLFGVPPDTRMKIGGSLALTHERDRARVEREIESAIAGRADYSCEFRIAHPMRGERWIQSQGRLVFDDGGEPRRLIGLSFDVTERKRHEAQRAEAEAVRKASEERLLRASRLSEIGQMAAALAHELNQPLTAVTSYIGGCRRMLRTDLADAAGRHRLLQVMDQANAQALRAGDIIRRLREFIGQGDTARTIEDAAGVIREASSLAVVDARFNGVSVGLDFDASGRILVDKVQVQQVVVNLVRNAVEAMEVSPRKELVIGLQRNASHVEVSVSDTGSGIPPEMAGRLFSPFSSTKNQGMGIGLSVCREIAEAHDGKIWTEPNPDGGTVFRFTLPLVREEMVA